MAENFDIKKTLTVTNDVYTIGDGVGGLITLPGIARSAGQHSMITEVTLAGVAALAYQLWLFDADIATPCADNAVLAMVAADLAMCQGVIPIATTNYLAPVSSFNFGTINSSSTANLPKQVTPVATTLYAYLEAMAVTSPGTTTLTLHVKGFWMD